VLILSLDHCLLIKTKKKIVKNCYFFGGWLNRQVGKVKQKLKRAKRKRKEEQKGRYTERKEQVKRGKKT
jgi:hypothetical protein